MPPATRADYNAEMIADLTALAQLWQDVPGLPGPPRSFPHRIEIACDPATVHAVAEQLGEPVERLYAGPAHVTEKMSHLFGTILLCCYSTHLGEAVKLPLSDAAAAELVEAAARDELADVRDELRQDSRATRRRKN